MSAPPPREVSRKIGTCFKKRWNRSSPKRLKKQNIPEWGRERRERRRGSCQRGGEGVGRAAAAAVAFFVASHSPPPAGELSRAVKAHGCGRQVPGTRSAFHPFFPPAPDSPSPISGREKNYSRGAIFSRSCSQPEGSQQFPL